MITGRRLLIVATVAVTALAIVTAFHDVPAVARALGDFDWRLLPPALALSAVMHLLRCARWHLYARRIAGDALSTRDSLLIYGAGLGTHLTPGRVGEAVRFAFLRRAAGTPVSRSAPILLAERLMDAVGLLGLALPGALVLGLGGRLALILLTVPLLIVPLLALHRTHVWIEIIAARTPLVRRFVRQIADAGTELRALLTPAMVVPAAALSLAAMALEVGTFAVVLDGAGVPLTMETYLRAAFILPTAMLATAIFLVPGNIGVAEGGLAALTRVTLSVPVATAAGAAILTRLCTLWLGLAAGAVALPIATHRWGRARVEPAPAPAEEPVISR
jgi:glycosyltransferase 2 family protein